jgi:1-acyl-sn-glycerol-3-phosphate acyltransferase
MVLPGIGRFQPTAKRVFGPLLRRYYCLQVVGDDHVPTIGPAIIAPNHRSLLDAPMLMLACPRRVVCMGARDVLRFGPRRLWHELGGFPVDRHSTDLGAYQSALALLKRGEALGVFPEGRRSHSDGLLPFHGGAAWLAVRTGTPIVPCAITGISRSERRAHKVAVRVVFGHPIAVQPTRDPTLRRALEDGVTSSLLSAVHALLGQEGC